MDHGNLQPQVKHADLGEHQGLPPRVQGVHEENGEAATPGGADFDCNICLDSSKNPVVTLCGHLYCRQCLLRWLSTARTCPVCKACLQEREVIPLYGRRVSKTGKPRLNIPERNGIGRGYHTIRAVLHSHNLSSWQIGAESGIEPLQLVPSCSLFPALFGLCVNSVWCNQGVSPNYSTEMIPRLRYQQEDRLLHCLFLCLCCLAIACLVLF